MAQERQRAREGRDKNPTIENALIRKCCFCLSSPSSCYNIIDYLSWKLDVVYVCTQVIDKRRRHSGGNQRHKQRASKTQRKLHPLSLIAYTMEESRTRAATERFRYLSMEWEKRKLINLCWFLRYQTMIGEVNSPFPSHNPEERQSSDCPVGQRMFYTLVHITDDISISQDKFSFDRHAAVAAASPTRKREREKRREKWVSE